MAKIQPFQLEPCYAPGEEKDVERSDEEDPKECSESHRIGNTSWCVCWECQPMSSTESCFCCQELEELNQKFDESG